MNALLKIDKYLRETANSIRRPQSISQNKWSTIKRVAESINQLKREDFLIIRELCRLLKVFDTETRRVKNKMHISIEINI